MMMRSDNSSSGNSSGGHRNQIKEFYIYDLPPASRRQLCEHLDALQVWKQLSKSMQLRPEQISVIERQESLKHSPIDELLKIWGSYNHIVDELYVVLYKQKLFQAMRLIKDYVGPIVRTRCIIPNSQPDLSAILPSSNSNNRNTEKILNCGSSSGVNTRDDNYTTTSSNVSSSIAPTTSKTSDTQDRKLLSDRNIREIAKAITEIKYEELTAATNNWDPQYVLGKGGFGTVYKGLWKFTEIAIKRLEYRGRDSDANSAIEIQQSLNELKYLYECRHDNLLPLYGYCIRGDKPCLVYQFMEYGSLEHRLHYKKDNPLTFQQRVDICLGTARGINWIHTREKPLIHGDIKPANVLLDRCLQAKIGDFGLAREGPSSIKLDVCVPRVFGTRCYLPPEFLKLRKLSTQVDTYSFGVTMLETFTGLRAETKSRQIPYLTDYIIHLVSQDYDNIVKLCDKTMILATEQELQLYKQLFQLGIDCISPDPRKRPDMEKALETIAELKFKYPIV